MCKVSEENKHCPKCDSKLVIITDKNTIKTIKCVKCDFSQEI